MEWVGLMPSHTGKPGGKKTGQQMADYAIIGGVFEQALSRLPAQLKLPLMSRELSLVSFVDAALEGPGTGTMNEAPVPPKPQKNKIKYTCPTCSANIWGKADLNVRCGDCEVPFLMVG